MRLAAGRSTDTPIVNATSEANAPIVSVKPGGDDIQAVANPPDTRR